MERQFVKVKNRDGSSSFVIPVENIHYIIPARSSDYKSEINLVNGVVLYSKSAPDEIYELLK